jgi:dihydrofolate reductase
MKLFIAQTIDGFIAGRDDSLDHLDLFAGNDYGYDAFIAGIEAVVIGRRTFDRIVPQHGWTYPAHVTGYVLTRRPLPDGLPPQVSAASSLEDVAAKAPDAFLDGGASTIRQALKLGLVRSARIFTLPVRIGTGIRLFEDAEPCRDRWVLETVRTFPCGTTEAVYRIG